MRTAPRSLQRILYKGTGVLPSLLRQVTFLQEIQSTLEAAWPPEAAGHVRVAACDNGYLLLIVDSGVWATRLRYQHEAISRILAQRLRIGVTDIQVRVRPTAYQPQAGYSATRAISPGNRRLLAESARHIDDPKLAAALSRLATSGGKTTG